MNLKENAGVKGELSVYLDYHDNKPRVEHFRKGNLIVTDTKRFLLSGVYSSGVVSDPVTSLQAGVGGTIDPEGLYPKSEEPAQTGLWDSIITVPTVYVLDLVNIKVTFLADISQSESNNQLINEAGLFTNLGDLFSVKNFPAVTKTNQFSIHFEWSIYFL